MNIHVIVISNNSMLLFKMKKKEASLRKGKCYIGFIAMETGMCIRRIDSADDDFEL